MRPIEVAITGIGALCNLGNDWQQIVASPAEDSKNFVPWPESSERPSEKAWIAPIAAPSAEKYLPQRQLRALDRFLIMSVCAVGQALEFAKLDPSDTSKKEELGLIFGTSRPEFGGFQRFASPVLEKQLQKINPGHFPLLARNAAAGQAAITFGLKGYSNTLAVNHVSGIHAIMRAADLIRLGRCRSMLAGGVECLSRLSLGHSLSYYKNHLDQTDPRFLGNQPGLVVPAEGVCVVVLEELNHALERGAQPLALIKEQEFGRSLDSGSYAKCCQQVWSRQETNRCAWVSISASGGNMPHDQIESEALATLWNGPDYAPPISALKAWTGETEAAGSAFQVAESAWVLAGHSPLRPPLRPQGSRLKEASLQQSGPSWSFLSSRDPFGNHALMTLAPASN